MEVIDERGRTHRIIYRGHHQGPLCKCCGVVWPCLTARKALASAKITLSICDLWEILAAFPSEYRVKVTGKKIKVKKPNGKVFASIDTRTGQTLYL